MPPVKNFKDLVVWQKGMDVVKAVYHASALLPPEEKFGLTGQMRRCAISIPSNIAEGKKRGSKADYARFLDVANGSAAELETQLILAGEFYPAVDFAKTMATLEEVQKMLTTLLVKIRN
ncbi:MAG: four helix bundle protein [Proteobacteria bacterium]|nr:four helix bundle protein [Pseudomonadota bacterium]